MQKFRSQFEVLRPKYKRQTDHLHGKGFNNYGLYGAQFSLFKDKDTAFLGGFSHAGRWPIPSNSIVIFN
jgi:hypothetical protein